MTQYSHTQKPKSKKTYRKPEVVELASEASEGKANVNTVEAGTTFAPS